MSGTTLDLASREKFTTWGDFVALPENRLALGAARRFAHSFSKRSSFPNPLYFHGPSGTGKSFLTQTLLKMVITESPDITAQIIATSDIKLFASDGDGDLLEAWINLDLLILEGVQYLPKRLAGQVIRLLDLRRANRRATVVTASVGPAGLKELPSKLTSRLGAGLVLQLAPLAFPSRRILAEQLTSQKQVFLTDDALDLLASDPTGGGVRPLIGNIERLLRLNDGRSQILDKTEVQKLLANEPSRNESVCDRVIRKVAVAFGISTRELLGKHRHKNILKARQVAMFLARKIGNLSYPQIGIAFNGRDHTTVLHACEQIKAALNTDVSLKQTLQDLMAELS